MPRLGLAVLIAIIVTASGFAGPRLARAQVSVPTQTIDPFGQEVTFERRTIVYQAGKADWTTAFESLIGAFKTVQAYLGKAGLKATGPALTIYTSTSDTGFEFRAAFPLAEAPKTPPANGVAVGTSPEGKMFKFVHRGNYAAMDQTYEAITNFLDDKNLEAKDLLIEEYVTDPLKTPEDNLVINIFVPFK